MITESAVNKYKIVGARVGVDNRMTAGRIVRRVETIDKSRSKFIFLTGTCFARLVIVRAAFFDLWPAASSYTVLQLRSVA